MMENELGQIVDGQEPTNPNETESSIQRDTPDPDAQRAALVTQLTSEVQQAREYWTRQAFEQMKRDMKFAAGDQWPEYAADQFVDEASERYVANITLRHVQSRTAAVYGKNPKVVARRKNRLMSTVWDGNAQTVQAAMQAVEASMAQTGMPDPAAQAIVQDAMQTMAHNQKMDRISKTLEILFEHELDEQPVPFKQQMKSTVRRGLTTAVGYVKLGYQRVMQNDPDVELRITDAAQRLGVLERLSADLMDGEVDQNSAEAEELRLLLDSLSKQQEIIVREGLVLNYPESTAIIPDMNCKQLRGFVGCSWVAEEYYMTANRIKEVYKVDVSATGGAKPHVQQMDGAFKPRGDDESKAEEYFCVWEIYNKTNGLVYTICEGHPDFLTQPGEPDVWLERFWPWFAFVVNEIYADGKVYPPSDVFLMRDMQLELNRSRQGLREHRRANRPKTYTRKGALEQDDKDKIIGCQANEVIELQGLQPNEDIKDVLQTHAGPPIDPSLYDPSPSYDDYHRTLGQHEASLGGTSGATATETSIAEGSRMSHVSSVVDDLDEFLTELCRAGGQILMMEASAERVREVVGPGAVWPEMSRAEAAKEIFLDVEAASTGRPNQAQQVQAAQQVFPMLMQVPGVSPEWMARELLRRLDDRVDLTDAFTPGIPSVMMLNRMQQMASPDAVAQGNAPDAQGVEGGDNAPGTAPPQVNAAPRPDAGPEQTLPI